ncbi:MAG TPA: hypothetical protein VEA16_09000, partial [Vicinamibacterales bacterium]|nr:hypothetical protein [Vicinamibacterales bacterium]
MRLWIVAVLLAGVAVRAQSPGEPASIDSQRRAAAVVEDAVRAMGGIERLSAISSLTLSEVGQHQWPHQSATARPPWRTGERTEETVLDRKGERLFIDARVSRPDYYFGWPGTIVIGTSGFTLDHHSRMVTPIPRTSLDNFRAHLFQRFPHEVLLDA